MTENLLSIRNKMVEHWLKSEKKKKKAQRALQEDNHQQEYKNTNRNTIRKRKMVCESWTYSHRPTTPKGSCICNSLKLPRLFSDQKHQQGRTS
ncbi:hypothetical protein C1H46_028389 [Malus baccata]|uniref:Uncharacterized protein n=1 Tax=Malus baccata TaxID=106549 RepID=A0A540LHX6_MALBA|nr:hypothetical protein C1H46_028389 [Malus baccata]